MTSRARSSRPLAMCRWPIPGKNIRQIKWLRPYSDTNLRRRAPQRQVSPAADPHRGMRLRHRQRLEFPVHRVVLAPELDALATPEPPHDRELLLEACAAPGELGAVERELVRLVADGDAER